MRFAGHNAGAGQEVAQGDQLPNIGEVFVRRPLHGVGLPIERQVIGAVVAFRDRANRLQQAHQAPPLQVMRHRVLEDSVQGALVFSAQLRSRHTRFAFGGAAVPRGSRATRPATQCGGASRVIVAESSRYAPWGYEGCSSREDEQPSYPIARETIKGGPEYDPAQLNRAYDEQRLYRHYRQPSYWDEAPTQR